MHIGGPNKPSWSCIQYDICKVGRKLHLVILSKNNPWYHFVNILVFNNEYLIMNIFRTALETVEKLSHTLDFSDYASQIIHAIIQVRNSDTSAWLVHLLLVVLNHLIIHFVEHCTTCISWIFLHCGQCLHCGQWAGSLTLNIPALHPMPEYSCTAANELALSPLVSSLKSEGSNLSN